MAAWPVALEELSFPEEEAHMESVMQAIRAVRNRRAEMNVPPSKKATLYVVTQKQVAFQEGVPFHSAPGLWIRSWYPGGPKRL